MPTFSFEVRNAQGRPQRGREDAPSAAAMAATLRGRGLLILNLREDTGGAASISLDPRRLLRIRSVDIEFAMQQIAVMLRSGMTLLSSLRTAAEQARRYKMRAALNGIADRIQQGATLTEAMAAYRSFPHIVVQLVKVGEQTGTLEVVLTRAAEALERKRLLVTQLVTALFYPLIVFVSAISVAGVLVFYVIPKLQVLLSALGRKLPPLTQNLIDVTHFFNEYARPIGIGLLGLFAAFVALYLWPPGRLFLDRRVLRVPLIGYLLRLAATVQFSHGLAILLRSGVTLVEALRTVEALHRNRYIAGLVHTAREEVIRGGSLAPTLGAPGGFLPMLSKMTAVGEASGTLDDVLAEVARFHEGQLQATIRRLSVVIEPVIIFVVGGIVGFVYIAFFMAIYSTAGNFR
ncbi:MAG: type II secretion system F family protein [Gemmataceae bacterium]